MWSPDDVVVCGVAVVRSLQDVVEVHSIGYRLDELFSFTPQLGGVSHLASLHRGCNLSCLVVNGCLARRVNQGL